MAATNEEIPVIDFSLFSSDPEECARQICVASQGIGFFYLRNHGIDQGLIDRMFAQSEKYFAQDMEEKYKHRIQPHNNGYTPFLGEILGGDAMKGDNKEAFNLRTYALDNEYGHAFSMNDEIVRKELETFFKSLHNLARQVMQCFAIALKISEKDGGKHYFDSYYVWEELSGTTLRFLRYPQQDCDPGIPGAGAHTDYGGCTFLIQNRIPGLQVQANRVRDDVPWMDAPVIPGTILVNIGDMLQMWTNGLFKSTMHRVVYHEMQRTSPRYSIACFIHPSNDVRLEPIPSPLTAKLEQPQVHKGNVMTAKEYLDFRLNATHDYKA
ncbi:hypothetical protein BGW42_005624 [Actinomortierella wolfii]|nr:hypothetical protein BGW42_005624 [Actinomortierella wolfii]